MVEESDGVEVKLGSSDKTYSAEVVGTDPATDVALLKVDAPADSLHPLGLGDSSKVEVGDPVVAIGNPFGLDRTVTSGIVSALQRQIQAPNGFSISHVIQTDAAINPGNSGGPLIDSSGSVIGINSQIQTGGSSGNVGIGFAVPINTAREVVKQIEEHGEVKHAYLGISGGSITPELAKALKLPVEEGVLVNEVVKGGPADKAGIKGGDTSATIEGASVRLGGDMITEVDGKKVEGMEEVINAVNAAQPGDELKLTIDRDGDTKKVTVDAGRRCGRRVSARRPSPCPTMSAVEAWRRCEPRVTIAPAERLVGASARSRARWTHRPPRVRLPSRVRSYVRMRRKSNAASPYPGLYASEDLWCDQSRRRSRGRAAGGLGDRADPLRREPAARATRRGRADRRRVSQEVRGGRACSSIPSWSEVAKAVEDAGLTMVQLNGEEGPSFCAEVARRTGVKVVKAIHVASAADVHAAEAFRTDFHLFDRRGDGLWGGTGESFDWGLLAERRSEVPAIVAGGLRPDNVAEAIAVAHPYAVDVASGVEAEPGRKDHAAMTAFFEAAKTASVSAG